jgi:hypothetical protein
MFTIRGRSSHSSLLCSFLYRESLRNDRAGKCRLTVRPSYRQDPQHYEFFDSDAILPNLTGDPKSFTLLNVTQSTPQKLFEWEPGRRHAPQDIAWPPQGVKLSFFYSPPSTPALHFEPAGRWQPKNGGGSGTVPAPVWQHFAVHPAAAATRYYWLEVTHTFSPYQPMISEVRFKQAGGSWLNNSAASARAVVVGASGSSGGASPWWAMDGNVTTAWDSAMAPSPVRRNRPHNFSSEEPALGP